MAVAVSEPSARRFVLVGGGRTGRTVLAGLPGSWSLVVIDPDADAVEALRSELGGRDLLGIVGDATSRLVLRQAGIDRKSVVVVASGNDDVNLEVARLARKEFGVEELTCVLNDPSLAADSGLDEQEIVLRPAATAGHLLNRVSAGSTMGVTVGLGQGELLQVTVLEGSPAIGRPLREIGAPHWLLAAVYRSGRLIVPHGRTTVEAGDRVLLVGAPDVLADVGAWFRGGDPVFPSQYGRVIGWSGGEAVRGQAEWLASHSRADSVLSLDAAEVDPSRVRPSELRRVLESRDIGCLVLGPRRIPWYARVGLAPSSFHGLVLGSGRPVLIAREGPPFDRVLVCLVDTQVQRTVALTAFDVSRLSGLPLAALSVSPPALGGAAASGVADGPRDMRALARLHGVELSHVVDEGNPIERIRHHARPSDLVVLGISPAPVSPFSPDVSVSLLASLPCSALFVPWKPVAG